MMLNERKFNMLRCFIDSYIQFFISFSNPSFRYNFFEGIASLMQYVRVSGNIERFSTNIEIIFHGHCLWHDPGIIILSLFKIFQNKCYPKLLCFP